MTPTETKRAQTSEYRGKHWLTRPRPGVDRMSSAWLIQRFIDPQASFIFGEPNKAPDAIPFDTFEADFGHHGSACTFETLCQRFEITDSAVLQIGRIVHDLDLKESQYKESDTETVGTAGRRPPKGAPRRRCASTGRDGVVRGAVSVGRDAAGRMTIEDSPPSVDATTATEFVTRRTPPVTVEELLRFE
jgi:hypothetical protein